jgi:hypothetical protein
MSDSTDFETKPETETEPQELGFTPEQIEAMRQVKQAQKDGKNPIEVLNALFPEPIEFAGLTVGPLTLGKFLFLERLRNPIADPEGDEPSAEREAEAMYILCHPLAEVRQRHGSLSAEEWSAALQDWLEDIPAAELVRMRMILRKRNQEGFETLMQTKGKEGIGGNPPSPAADSAGG